MRNTACEFATQLSRSWDSRRLETKRMNRSWGTPTDPTAGSFPLHEDIGLEVYGYSEVADEWADEWQMSGQSSLFLLVTSWAKTGPRTLQSLRA